MSRHDDLTALTYGEAPHINSPAFKKIFDLGAEYDLPVLVHHNITGQNVDDVLYLDELKEALTGIIGLTPEVLHKYQNRQR